MTPMQPRTCWQMPASRTALPKITFDGKKVPLDFWYMPVSRPYYPNPKDVADAIAADLAKAGIKVHAADR